MMKLELIATATFGLEAVVKRELEKLQFKILKSEDGKITFLADERGLVQANLWLRSADRVLLKLAEFTAADFETLFQEIQGIAWEEWIPPDGNFHIACTSVKSKLHSAPACQSVSEKAVVTRLGRIYGLTHFEKSGVPFSIRLTLLRDRVTVSMDISGDGLHKRGYRVREVDAPIRETLAAALVQLSYWKPGRLLLDPFCGSGTIAIEAAMIGKNQAPGLGRAFAAETWPAIPNNLWKEERTAAFSAVNDGTDIRIEASDVSKQAVEAARENALEAGVGDCLAIRRQAFEDCEAKEPSGIIICNPPYGARIGSQADMGKIYRALGAFYRKNPSWTLYLITADKAFEKTALGRPADRRRKLYNGRIETCYYQYYGARPAQGGRTGGQKGNHEKEPRPE